ncbi:MAG: YiiX/YebB-like N1pC/P60 family cysteine hydrolase [Salibacteraceae bacterium]
MSAIVKILSGVLCVCLVTGCGERAKRDKTISLQSGDIVFVSSEANGLAGAINDVTKQQTSRDYVHMAILELTHGDTFLLHADTDRGVSRERISSFSKRYPNTDVYRIEKLEPSSVDKAINVAKTHLGKPYNYSYYNNDSALYCSQLVYLAFEHDSVFRLNPMTFKNPDSDSFNGFWTSYYDSLGVAIPEGVEGCNPNHMSESRRLKFITSL